VLEASQEHRLHHKDGNKANKRIENVVLLHRSCQLQPQLLSRRLFHRQFPRLFPGRFSSISRTDHTGEIALESATNWEGNAGGI
jgi:hypothetical protein